MSDVEPIGRRFFQRRLGTAGRLEIGQFRQIDWQVVRWHGADTAGRLSVGVQFVQDRKRFAPEMLAAKKPIAKLRSSPRRGPARAGQIGDDFRFECGVERPLYGPELIAMPSADEDAAGEDFSRDRRRASPGSTTGTIGRPNMLGEFEVAFIVRRHGHDRPRAVAGEHIVGNPNRHRLAVHRIDCIGAAKNARFCFGEFCPIDVALRCRFVDNIPSRGANYRASSAVPRADAPAQ